jgi:hypothetical protein
MYLPYNDFRTHGDAPQVTIHGRTDLTFPYVPSHISYILLELLKNSMRASVEYHGIDNMPPIRIVIADGEKNEDVIIKVKYYHYYLFYFVYYIYYLFIYLFIYLLILFLFYFLYF